MPTWECAESLCKFSPERHLTYTFFCPIKFRCRAACITHNVFVQDAGPKLMLALIRKEAARLCRPCAVFIVFIASTVSPKCAPDLCSFLVENSWIQNNTIVALSASKTLAVKIL